MSPPNPFASPVDPIAEGYRARLKNSTHCEAAKDLMLFMRASGFRCDVLTVGKDGVAIQGLVDDYPRKQPKPEKPEGDGEGRLYADD